LGEFCPATWITEIKAVAAIEVSAPANTCDLNLSILLSRLSVFHGSLGAARGRESCPSDVRYDNFSVSSTQQKIALINIKDVDNVRLFCSLARGLATVIV
jgi:hypothetical protein